MISVRPIVVCLTLLLALSSCSKLHDRPDLEKPIRDNYTSGFPNASSIEVLSYVPDKRKFSLLRFDSNFVSKDVTFIATTIIDSTAPSGVYRAFVVYYGDCIMVINADSSYHIPNTDDYNIRYRRDSLWDFFDGKGPPPNFQLINKKLENDLLERNREHLRCGEELEDWFP